mgnify:CR=1 FL=1
MPPSFSFFYLQFFYSFSPLFALFLFFSSSFFFLSSFEELERKYARWPCASRFALTFVRGIVETEQREDIISREKSTDTRRAQCEGSHRLGRFSVIRGHKLIAGVYQRRANYTRAAEIFNTEDTL